MASNTKQLRRRRWFTLEGAAKRLSNECDEEADVTYVLQKILEGELTASLVVHEALQALKLTPDPRPGLNLVKRSSIDSPIPTYEALEENRSLLAKGIYRVGTESAPFQKYLFDIVSESPLHETYAGPWYVTKAIESPGAKPAEEECFLPLKPNLGNSAYPLEIPPINRLVVLSKDLDSFIESLPEDTGHAAYQDSELHPRRKNSYLKVIAALLGHCEIDLPPEPYKAAAVLNSILETRGDSMSVNTLRSILDDLP